MGASVSFHALPAALIELARPPEWLLEHAAGWSWWSATASVPLPVVYAAVALLTWLVVSPYLRRQSRVDPDAAKLRSARQNAFRAATYPPAFPNGWYKLCNSKDIKRGETKYFQFLNRHFAVYRGKTTGVIGVLDAFCPHLGANLCIGGTVVGDCLRCPFHGWSFSADGKCDNIPYYNDKPPESAHTKAWTCEERYGMVVIWFDAEGRPPSWHLPVVEGIEKGTMTMRGRAGPINIGMHIQEWAENGVDYAHFDVLHSRLMVPWTNYNVPFVEVIHNGKYSLDEENRHISYFDNDVYIHLFGFRLPIPPSHARIHFVGPGGIVYLEFTIPFFGTIILFEAHTPRESMVMKTDWLYYADRWIPNFIVSFYVGEWASQIYNDIEVWENKIYRQKPVLLKTDGPVAKFRRWYQQFYSENSREAAASSIEW